MTQNTKTSIIPLDPDPGQWLDKARREVLERDLASCSSLLRRAGLLRSALSYWVRWQVSLDAEWPPEEEQGIMQERIQKWHDKHPGVLTALTEQELKAKLRVAPAAALWSRQQWSHRLQSLYLRRKSFLDRASCRVLQVKDKHLALELYHRIKANEVTFERASLEFGVGKERSNGGLLPLQPLEDMPYGLAPLVQKLTPGKLSMPLALGKQYALVLVEAWQPSQLDQATEEFLLAEQLRLWVDSVVDLLDAALSSSQQTTSFSH